MAVNNTCPPSQTLNPSDMFCYWDLPNPDRGLWQTQDLQPIVITLSNPNQTCGSGSNAIKWSGNIWGATGCDKPPHTCETAICFDGRNPALNGHTPDQWVQSPEPSLLCKVHLPQTFMTSL